MAVTEQGVAALAASDIMTSPAVSISPDDTVWRAWALMSALGVRHLIVTVEDRCIGMVDDRTVFAQWPMGPLALRRHHVAEIMRVPVTCVLPRTEMREVAQVMRQDNVDSVPVVDTEGRVIGIITGSDLATAVARS